VRKVRCSRNRERIESDDLLGKLMGLVFVYRGMIRVKILKNIALVSYALITLFQGVLVTLKKCPILTMLVPTKNERGQTSNVRTASRYR
jgi:hypothetical protein